VAPIYSQIEVLDRPGAGLRYFRPIERGQLITKAPLRLLKLSSARGGPGPHCPGRGF
jgi:hypothetical protein